MKSTILKLCVTFLIQIPISAQKKNTVSLDLSDPSNTYAAIIADEDYQSYSKVYTENALHAIYDAERFRNLLIKEYHVPEWNISYYPDALTAHIKLYLSKLGRLAEKSENTHLIFYFSGKFKYNADDIGSSILLSVDVGDDDDKFSVRLDEVLTKLNASEAGDVTIYLDAADISGTRTFSMLDVGSKLVGLDPEYSKLSVYIPEKSSLCQNTRKVPALKPIEIEGTDVKPPSLVITSPSEDWLSEHVFTEKEITVKGFAFDENGISKVIVNREEGHLQSDGSFTAKTMLLMGPNKIEIIAMDFSDNKTTSSILIERKIKEEAVRTGELDINSNAAEISEAQAKFYALIIGINDYENYQFPDLDKPVNDAQRLYDILISDYSFEKENVVFLRNPHREDIIKALDKLEYFLKENDNLLIFYAGHGMWDEHTQRGYWIPADASISSTSNWIRNSTISGYISGLKTKHTLIIADACFSGGIFKTRAAMPDTPSSVQRLYELPSRKAMTSGTLKEVPDESVFLYYLTKKLEENQDHYLPSEQLFHSFKPAVLNNSDNIPQFGVIKNSGDEGGDFIFIKK